MHETSNFNKKICQTVWLHESKETKPERPERFTIRSQGGSREFAGGGGGVTTINLGGPKKIKAATDRPL